MPNTPSVNFIFENNNYQESVPLLGVSHVVARTTKGKFNDPSEIINSWSQFQSIFGDEIVPDGTISNIKKALEIGSKLRVSRVAGSGSGLAYGKAKVFTIGGEEGIPDSDAEATKLILVLTNPNDGNDKIKILFEIQTQEQGSSVVDDSGYNLNRNFYLVVSGNSSPIYKVYITQYKDMDTKTGNLQNSNIIDSRRLMFSSISATNSGSNKPSAYIESQVFADFINSVPNITFVPVQNGITDGSDSPITGMPTKPTISDIISILKTHNNWYGDMYIDDTDSETPITDTQYFVINEGDNGGESDEDTWLEAFKATRQYDEEYQVILSHIHQHLGDTEWQSVYKNVADIVTKNFEDILYIEVPKYNQSTGQPYTPDEIATQLETLVPQIGYSKNLAYFVGGIKYYDNDGAIQDCDLLGSVIGLGDVSASQYGPWKSFAGMNRGIIASSLGPVCKNLGSSSEIDSLQEIAQNYGNLFLIKDTPNAGKRTMLWHNFTSNPTFTSDRFISSVRAQLYLKKNLRPILYSYIEEPNIWDTWYSIYIKCKKVVDNLVDGNAITSDYQWLGDQNAKSWADLQINNEADVRAGKYKAILKYKDIVTLQEITMVVVNDQSTGTTDISFE